MWILCVGLACLTAGTAQAQHREPLPWLGVGFNSNGPLRVTEVVADTPADIAGVLVGDVIRAVDSVNIRVGADLIKAIKAHEVGDRVALKIYRRGTMHLLHTELTGKLDKQELIQRRLVGERAPDFSLPGVQGKAPGALSKLRGTVVVIAFWTTSCAVCKTTFQPLASFQAEHIGNAVVLTVTTSDKSAVTNYLNNYQLGVTVLHDARAETRKSYRYHRDDGKQVPTAVVIGRDGFVRHADTGVNFNLDDVLLAARRATRERAPIE